MSMSCSKEDAGPEGRKTCSNRTPCMVSSSHGAPYLSTARQRRRDRLGDSTQVYCAPQTSARAILTTGESEARKGKVSENSPVFCLCVATATNPRARFRGSVSPFTRGRRPHMSSLPVIGNVPSKRKTGSPARPSRRPSRPRASSHPAVATLANEH